MTKYSHYVRHIRRSLMDQEVRAQDLCSDLLTMPATNSDEQELALLSAHKDELERAVTLNEIFNFLVTNCASFLEYDIFQFIVDTYQLNNGQEELKYPELLKAYLEKHKVSEFLKIKPLIPVGSEVELVLKMDIKLTVKMSKVTDLKKKVTMILGLKSYTLQLVDVKEGCVAVILHIPVPVAEFVFNKRTLSAKQYQQFKDLGVISLEYKGHRFIFA